MGQYIAHRREDGCEQSLKDHLGNVAELCESFSVDELKPYAYTIGLLHDIGKYSCLFQERIKGKEITVEHALSGGKEAIVLFGDNMVSSMFAFCIAGHHTGLPDGGKMSDIKDEGTLLGKLKRTVEDYSAYRNEIVLRDMNIGEFPIYLRKGLRDPQNKVDIIEKYAFIVKYLFSCLTDADFLDTERFCNLIDRCIEADFSFCLDLLNREINGKPQKTRIQRCRSLLQSQAFDKVNESADIYMLNMPTGSGKTLCSMKFALERIKRTNKKRIIYVIPYTSIIEQTAETFENIFGEHIQILQHHSNYSYDSDDINESNDCITKEKMKRATENWDAPIIITTNVQFFQSIFGFKKSRLRKLHNMSDSIIIFDEIHMMPIKYLQPCLRAIGYVTKLLHSEALFLTATMPNFRKLFDLYLLDSTVINLITDKTLFAEFQNCIYEYLGKCSLDNIIVKSQNYTSSLIIVNSRKVARNLYAICPGRKYHLSTYMTGYDRSDVIAHIRADLSKGMRITVISTSLIEAGVDLDFEAVFRELAGLDSIIQSGGRCNREGRKDKGYVYIFENETISSRQTDLSIRANIAREVICNNKVDRDVDILSPSCIESYYDQLYSFYSNKIEENSIANNCNDPRYIPFRTYAEGFHMIDTDTIAIIIERDSLSHNLIQELRYGGRAAKRRLQKYAATVYLWEFDLLYRQGVLDDFGTGVYCLTNNDYYDINIGLLFEGKKNYIV